MTDFQIFGDDLERFHLKFHRETRELPIYALSFVKNGVKGPGLTDAPGDPCGPPGPLETNAAGCPARPVGQSILAEAASSDSGAG